MKTLKLGSICNRLPGGTDENSQVLGAIFKRLPCGTDENSLDGLKLKILP